MATTKTTKSAVYNDPASPGNTGDAAPATPPPERPEWWDFDTDGAHLEGTFVTLGRGFTAMGERPFCVLEVEGTARTLWLHNEVLRNSFVREVHRRPDHAIHVGETVRVWRLDERESGSGRKYIDYRVEFPDAPELSQVDLLGPLPPGDEPELKPTAEGGGGGGSDSDIPFL